MVEIDEAWLTAQFVTLINNTIKALRAECHIQGYDAEGYPDVVITDETIVHVIKKEALPVFAEIFLKLDPVGDLGEDEWIFVKGLLRQLLPAEYAESACEEIYDRFLIKRNIDQALLQRVSRVSPMFARAGVRL